MASSDETRPTSLTLFLVRHGQTAWTATGRAQGHTDVVLDDVGREQAARTAAAFSAKPVDAIWSSDLARCAATADPIARACGLTTRRVRELRERSFGAWEGDQMDDIRLRLRARADEEQLPLEVIRPPGGESHRDVRDRLAPVLESLHTQSGTLVVVSHGGVMAVVIPMLVGQSLEAAPGYRARNASITELERGPRGGFRLLRFDDVGHL